MIDLFEEQTAQDGIPLLMQPNILSKIMIHPYLDRFLQITDGTIELFSHLAPAPFTEVSIGSPLILAKVKNKILLVHNYFTWSEARYHNKPAYSMVLPMTNEMANKWAAAEVFKKLLLYLASQSEKIKINSEKQKRTQTAFTELLAIIIKELHKGEFEHLKSIVKDGTKLNLTQLGIILGHPHSTIGNWCAQLENQKRPQRRKTTNYIKELPPPKDKKKAEHTQLNLEMNYEECIKNHSK